MNKHKDRIKIIDERMKNIIEEEDKRIFEKLYTDLGKNFYKYYKEQQLTDETAKDMCDLIEKLLDLCGVAKLNKEIDNSTTKFIKNYKHVEYINALTKKVLDIKFNPEQDEKLNQENLINEIENSIQSNENIINNLKNKSISVEKILLDIIKQVSKSFSDLSNNKFDVMMSDKVEDYNKKGNINGIINTLSNYFENETVLNILSGATLSILKSSKIKINKTIKSFETFFNEVLSDNEFLKNYIISQEDFFHGLKNKDSSLNNIFSAISLYLFKKAPSIVIKSDINKLYNGSIDKFGEKRIGIKEYFINNYKSEKELKEKYCLLMLKKVSILNINANMVDNFRNEIKEVCEKLKLNKKDSAIIDSCFNDIEILISYTRYQEKSTRSLFIKSEEKKSKDSDKILKENLNLLLKVYDAETVSNILKTDLSILALNTSLLQGILFKIKDSKELKIDFAQNIAQTLTKLSIYDTKQKISKNRINKHTLSINEFDNENFAITLLENVELDNPNLDDEQKKIIENLLNNKNIPQDKKIQDQEDEQQEEQKQDDEKQEHDKIRDITKSFDIDRIINNLYEYCSYLYNQDKFEKDNNKNALVNKIINNFYRLNKLASLDNLYEIENLKNYLINLREFLINELNNRISFVHGSKSGIKVENDKIIQFYGKNNDGYIKNFVMPKLYSKNERKGKTNLEISKLYNNIKQYIKDGIIENYNQEKLDEKIKNYVKDEISEKLELNKEYQDLDKYFDINNHYYRLIDTINKFIFKWDNFSNPILTSVEEEEKYIENRLDSLKKIISNKEKNLKSCFNNLELNNPYLIREKNKLDFSKKEYEKLEKRKKELQEMKNFHKNKSDFTKNGKNMVNDEKKESNNKKNSGNTKDSDNKRDFDDKKNGSGKNINDDDGISKDWI